MTIIVVVLVVLLEAAFGVRFSSLSWILDPALNTLCSVHAIHLFLFGFLIGAVFTFS